MIAALWIALVATVAFAPASTAGRPSTCSRISAGELRSVPELRVPETEPNPYDKPPTLHG